jgi:hypothetical protein|tara:strand:+ start:214 stop:375 length:162 start_codon:yes stop_codon:yes gene_type:complete
MQTEKTEKMTPEKAGQYWYNRGFRDKELHRRVAETLNNQELLDNNNEVCKVCD